MAPSASQHAARAPESPAASASEASIAAAVAIFCMVLVAWVGAVVPLPDLIIDDGFYYLQIARNLARGLGSTFDGLHPTNGYHPLWLLLLVPIFRVVPDAEAALRLVFALEAALLAVAAVLLYLACRRVAGQLASCLATLLWIGLTYRLFFGGMEVALLTVALLALIQVTERWVDQRPFALGLLLAAACLARLDTILLAGVIITYAAARRVPAKRLLSLSVPVALAAAGYALWSEAVFGHPLPVSGVVKRDWSQFLLSQDPLYRSGGWLAAKAANVLWPAGRPLGPWSLALAAGTLGVAGAAWAGRVGGPLCRLTPFIAYSNLSYVAYAVLYHGRWSTSPWYYTVQPVLAAVLLAALAQWASRGLARRWRAALFTVALAGASLRILTGLEAPPGAGARPALEALAALPEGALLGSWNGGALAYLSGRPVVSLDGLANSWDYARQGRLDLCGYWRETGVTHLVDVFRFAGGRPVEPVFPGVPGYQDFRACAGRLRVLWTSGTRDPAARLAILALDG